MLTGGCQCGAVRYRIANDRPPVTVCHCGECRKQSASAFGMSLGVREEQLGIEGELACWEQEVRPGVIKLCLFCPTCGSRVMHRRKGAGNVVVVKGGSLDRPEGLTPDRHIWVSRKLPWVALDPDVPAHDTQP